MRYFCSILILNWIRHQNVSIRTRHKGIWLETRWFVLLRLRTLKSCYITVYNHKKHNLDLSYLYKRRYEENWYFVRQSFLTNFSSAKLVDCQTHTLVGHARLPTRQVLFIIRHSLQVVHNQTTESVAKLTFQQITQPCLDVNKQVLGAFPLKFYNTFRSNVQKNVLTHVPGTYPMSLDNQLK